MIKRRLLALGCAVTLAVALTACGAEKNENSGSTGGAKATVTQEAAADSESSSDTEGVPETDTEAAQNATVSQLAGPEKGETVAIMNIKGFGVIKVHFFEKAAPKAVENFISLAKSGYYDGLTFHRVINDFMIQGGDPTGTGTGGESTWGADFEDEINKYLIPLRGSLCMANAGGGNTNGSQFFLVQSSQIDSTDSQQLQDELEYYTNYYQTATGLSLDAFDSSVLDNYTKVGGCIHLSGGHSVFGQVYEGLDVLDEIAKTATDEKDKPVEDVVIQSVEITTYEGE